MRRQDRRTQLKRRSGAIALAGAVAVVLPVLFALTADPRQRQLVLVELVGALIGTIAGLLTTRLANGYRMLVSTAGSVAIGLLAVSAFLGAVHAPPGVLSDALGPLILTGVFYGAGMAALLVGAGSYDAAVPPMAPAAALVLMAIGFVPTAGLLTGFTSTPWFAGTVTYWAIAGAATAVVACAVGALLVRTGTGLIPRADAWLMAPRPVLFATSCAIAATALALFLGWYAFHFGPRTSDEYAQLWHARILLTGRLALPQDANPEFFAIDNVLDRGAWLSQFPIGGPVLLAMGYVIHAPMLVNPVLLGLTTVNVYVFARRAYDERLARIATLLFVLSPFALFMAASYMNHVPVLWLVTCALAAVPGWVEAANARAVLLRSATIGATLAAAVAFRPLDAFVVAVVIGAVQLGRIVRSTPEQRATYLRSLGVQFAAGLPFLLALFWVNARLYGAPLRFGYDVMYGAAHSPGFHVDPYGVPFTPVRGLQYASTYLMQLQFALFDWPIPALLAVVATLLLLRRDTTGRGWDALLTTLLLAQLVAYGMYWHLGQFRGPRFLYTVVPAVVILVARAPMLLVPRLRGTFAAAAIVFLPLCALAAWLPLPGSSGVWQQAADYRASGGRIFRPSGVDVVQSSAAKPALVFVDEGMRSMITRLLWAVGIPRATGISLSDRGDVCQELLAFPAELAHPDTATLESRFRLLAQQPVTDPTARAACLRFMVSHAPTNLQFSDYLLHDAIGPDGHVDGPVVYVADLGPHDEVLRRRFAGRTWYRLTAPRVPVAIDPREQRVVMGADTLRVARPLLVPYTVDSFASGPAPPLSSRAASPLSSRAAGEGSTMSPPVTSH